MRKPKKLTPLGRAKKSIREYVARIVGLTGQVSGLQLELAALRVQLDEARRRTIPYGNTGVRGDLSNGELNFLPLFIERVEINHNVRTFETYSGGQIAVAGQTTAVIHVRGDIVHYPGPAKK